MSVAGKALSDKLAAVADEARKAKADGYLAIALDEVAWLLNIRGTDVPHCPVLEAYALVNVNSDTTTTTTTDTTNSTTNSTTATLFVDLDKVPAPMAEALAEHGVTLQPYDAIEAAVRNFASQGKKLLLDPEKSTFAMLTAAADAAVLSPSPVTLPKALKNSAELAGMQQAHAVDGAALANFFGWLFDYVKVEGNSLTEAELATRLAGFRAAQPGFLDLSFPTIAGANANGAIIHYNPLVAENPATVNSETMLLLDSGGQYETGTTDVTRTVHLGTPTAWQKECFTRVLKGNIALDMVVFPEGTPGPAIDAFARTALWQVGLDYLHGTGHGVGAALNVHEGPQSISTRYANTVALKEGMVLSNEPGYYEANAFGVRIENLLTVRRKQTPHAFNGKTFLGFEQLTHVPIQKDLMEIGLLTPTELDWIDAYHARVWALVSPLLEEDSQGYKWLQAATTPLPRATAAAEAPVAAGAAA